MLKVGDKAPDFVVEGSNGPVRLSELKGKTVVLYFYPKDMTPGCTVEACAFRDFHADFAKKGVVVLGVSKDKPALHAKFREKYRLPFALLSDEDLKVMKDYEAWGEKRFLGKKYMGTFRVTYVIGPDGRISHVFPKVTPKDHAKEILSVL